MGGEVGEWVERLMNGWRGGEVDECVERLMSGWRGW